MDWRAIYKFFYFDFRLHVAFTLALVWLLALWRVHTVNAFLYPLLAIVFMVIFDLSTTLIRDHKIYLPSASLVSGFLIGLIFDPSNPWWIIAFACLLASLSKQFTRVGSRQHIFNPAAFGIMAASLIFKTPVAWWGVVAGGWSLVILIPLMSRILWRMGRLTLPITFLAVYFIYLTILSGPGGTVRTLADGTFMLFALVMLPEPMTSPGRGIVGFLFGATVAILAILLSNLNLLDEFLLPALLLGNLAGFLLVRFNKTSAKSPETKGSQQNSKA